MLVSKIFVDGDQDGANVFGGDTSVPMGGGSALFTQSREKLHLVQRLEAMNTLAGGIAHDFNNFLTVINGYADLVIRQLDKTDPISRPIAEIRKAGDRATSLTRQL